jgi:hypothetical protein
VGTRAELSVLHENNVRKGFFNEEQFSALLAHLSEDLQSVIRTAYITSIPRF